MKIIQVYAPTSDYANDEVEEFYDDITTALNESSTHFTMLCDDFNAKIGRKKEAPETSLSKYGLGGWKEWGATEIQQFHPLNQKLSIETSHTLANSLYIQGESP